MPKNTATIKSVQRQLRTFMRAQRGDSQRFRILVEGDSWFSTPVEGWKGPTLINGLKRHERNGRRQFNIVAVANPGADLRDMLTRENFDLRLATNPDWLKKQTYDLVLLSVGGNDILGSELDNVLLNVESGPGVKQCLAAASNPEEAARCVIDRVFFCGLLGRLEKQLSDFRVKVLKPLKLGTTPMLLHGYDYVIPSGKKLEVLGLPLIGPWLNPKFRSHKIRAAHHKPLVKLLIDEFNRTLRSVAKSQNRFFYLDLRGTLTDPADWADEIHPHSNTGIPKIRSHFVDAIHAIRDGTATSVMGNGVTDEFSLPCP